MPAWASFTARATLKPEGVIRAITVIIDAADPLTARDALTLIIDVDGARAHRVVLPRGLVTLTAGLPR